jgi:hypothetical protein
MWYQADLGPSIGLLMFEDSLRQIDVLSDAGDNTPVGTARRLGSDPAGLAVWRLNVHGAQLDGQWIVIDRQFVPAP